jgi:hypothetical protein
MRVFCATQRYSDWLCHGDGFSQAKFRDYLESQNYPHQVEKEQLLFQKVLGYANTSGSILEQLGSGGEHRGNMPPALTHLALISAASSVDRALGGTKDPGGSSAPILRHVAL